MGESINTSLRINYSLSRSGSGTIEKADGDVSNISNAVRISSFSSSSKSEK